MGQRLAWTVFSSTWARRSTIACGSLLSSMARLQRCILRASHSCLALVIFRRLMETYRYNTMIIMATALSTFKTPYVASIASPSDSPNIAIYALYPSAPASSATAPSKLIVLNMDYYAAESTSVRPKKSVNAGSILQSKSLRVSRFTAAGADATSGATFAGQSWENQGKVSGKKLYEMAPGGIVQLSASEGVLIEIS